MKLGVTNLSVNFVTEKVKTAYRISKEYLPMSNKMLASKQASKQASK